MSGLIVNYLSVCTMMVLPVERYHALLKPLNTRLRFWHAVTGFWFFAALLNMPTVLYAVYDEKTGQCVNAWNEITYAVAIVLFAALVALRS